MLIKQQSSSFSSSCIHHPLHTLTIMHFLTALLAAGITPAAASPYARDSTSNSTSGNSTDIPITLKPNGSATIDISVGYVYHQRY